MTLQNILFITALAWVHEKLRKDSLASIAIFYANKSAKRFPKEQSSF